MRPVSGERLWITEIFYSLQGEGLDAGCPTTFVRLTGCPLRCGYCDTTYAFHGGTWTATADVLDAVARHPARHVCVTGGEPLAQPACLALLSELCDRGYRVSLETSGARDISQVDARVRRVMDLKTPGSGEVKRNRYGNLAHLGAGDQIKFVICDRADYEWARNLIRERGLQDCCELLLSPSFGQVAAADLAEWLLEDALPARLQIQLHKYLWGDVAGR